MRPLADYMAVRGCVEAAVVWGAVVFAGDCVHGWVGLTVRCESVQKEKMRFLTGSAEDLFLDQNPFLVGNRTALGISKIEDQL